MTNAHAYNESLDICQSTIHRATVLQCEYFHRSVSFPSPVTDGEHIYSIFIESITFFEQKFLQCDQSEVTALASKRILCYNIGAFTQQSFLSIGRLRQVKESSQLSSLVILCLL